MTLVFGYFLGHWSFKVSDFLHHNRRKYGALFEYVAIFRKNLNMVLIRGLFRDLALLSSF